MFPNKEIPKPRRESERKCKITIKKRKDGTLIKEISGSCSDKELKALSQQKDIEENS